MHSTLLIHVLAGVLGLLFGYTALAAPKGARLHRRSGRLFAGAMLVMSLAGASIAAVRNVAPALNIPAGLLTAYLVITGLTTVRPLRVGSLWVSVAGMLVAMSVGLASLLFGFEALADPDGMRDGLPPFPFFMFGVVGVLGGVSDLRVIRSGALQGASRLARHLWRMCFALFIAALSFFIGQSDALPELLRVPALLAVPPLSVLGAMVYWLWRVRVRRRLLAATHGAPIAGRI